MVFLHQTPGLAQPKLKPFDLGGAWVSLPTVIQVKKNQGPDFDLFYFSRANMTAKPITRLQILFAYAGFAPDFPGDAAKNVPEKHITLNRNAARTRNWTDKDGRMGREVLVTVGKSKNPTAVHFIYQRLSKPDALIADGIIATIRSRPQFIR